MPEGGKPYKLPAAARLFLRGVAGGIFGDNASETPFTEQDFSQQEIDSLRVAITNALQDGRSYIRPADYPTQETAFNTDNPVAEIDQVFDDPARSALMSVGRANFDAEGTITDTYDFKGFPGMDEEKGQGRSVRIRVGMPDNPEILALTQKVFEAAGGKPAPVSISQEMDMQKEAEKQMGLIVLQKLAGDGQGEQQNSEGSNDRAERPAG